MTSLIRSQKMSEKTDNFGTLLRDALAFLKAVERYLREVITAINTEVPYGLKKALRHTCNTIAIIEGVLELMGEKKDPYEI